VTAFNPDRSLSAAVRDNLQELLRRVGADRHRRPPTRTRQGGGRLGE
jgi:hypothetical protein